MRALLITALLLLPQLAPAAFVEVEVASAGVPNEYTIQAFVIMQEDVSISVVDVGISAGGLRFKDINDDGGFFENDFFIEPSLQQNETVAFFTGSILRGVAVSNGQRLLMGSVVVTSPSNFALSISTATAFEITSTAGSILSPSQNTGDVLFVLPEPSGLLLMVLIGIGGGVRALF